MGFGILVAAILIFGVAIMIDRNRGEAGIPASPIANSFKIAFAIILITEAGALTSWFF